MAKVTAIAGEWTAVPDTGGQMLLEMRTLGCYVDTSGTQPADPRDGYVLADGEDMVIGAGVTVAVWPIRNDENAVVYAHLI